MIGKRREDGINIVGAQEQSSSVKATILPRVFPAEIAGSAQSYLRWPRMHLETVSSANRTLQHGRRIVGRCIVHPDHLVAVTGAQRPQCSSVPDRRLARLRVQITIDTSISLVGSASTIRSCACQKAGENDSQCSAPGGGDLGSAVYRLAWVSYHPGSEPRWPVKSL